MRSEEKKKSTLGWTFIIQIKLDIEIEIGKAEYQHDSCCGPFRMFMYHMFSVSHINQWQS